MLPNFIKKISFEIGLTEDYIIEKAREVLQIAGQKGLDLSLPILAGYDMNGPMTATFDASLVPLLHVQKGILSLHHSKIYKSILSAWDYTTIKNFRDKHISASDMGIVAELGAMYEHDGKIEFVNPIGIDKLHEMKRNVYMKAAEQGVKIAWQGNASDRVACLYMEADEEKRGNLLYHHFVEQNNTDTKKIFDSIQDKNGFFFECGKISFEPSPENIKSIDHVLTRIHTLNSMRLGIKDGKILMWRDTSDNKSFTLEDMKKFAKETLPKEWKADMNKDFCFDIIYEDGQEMSKESTARLMAEKIFGSKDFILTNIGDKKTDILLGKNTIFFPQYGTEAHRFCKENGIPSVPVLHAGDYSLILAAAKEMVEKGA